MSKSAEFSIPASTVLDQTLQIGDARCDRTVWNWQRESDWRTRDHDVISIVVRGGYVLEWASQSVVVEEGAAAIIPAGIRRRGRQFADCESVSISWFNLFSSVMHGSLTPFALYDTPTVLAGDIVRDLLQLHQDALPLSGAAPTIANTLERRRLAMDVLAMILPHLDQRRDAQPARHDLTPLLQWLDTEAGRRVSVDEMAEICGLSVSRFHRVFRHEIGDTPHNYLRRKRLAKAADLIRTTDLTIGEVAQRLDFADQFHFSRLFKAEYGTPPSGFRRRAQIEFL